MAQRSVPIRHVFEGGFATDFGAIAEIGLESDIMGARIRIPWLTTCENCYFQMDGAVRKIGGTTKVNSTEIASGEEIRWVFDYWKLGTSGTPSQKRVVYAGTTIQKDDADGSFSAIKTGLDDNTVPCGLVFNDTLILASDSNTDVPFTWDQSTFANLSGSPPNFSFMVSYANRIWAAGDAANPDTLYYSGLADETDWNGASNSGSLTISPNDGDKITGLAVYRNNLIVFKGPYGGSIHVVSGRTPSTFAVDEFFRGVGAVAHNSIFHFRDDLGFFAQDGSIRTFQAVDRFGDYAQSNIIWHVMTEQRRRVNFNQLKRITVADDPHYGYFLVCLPLDGATLPNGVVSVDYKLYNPNSPPDSPFGKVRISNWSNIDGCSVAKVHDPDDSTRQILMVGGNDGFLRKTQQPERSIDGSSSIDMRVKTPHFTYGSPQSLKTLQAVGFGIEPRGDYELAVDLELDKGAEGVVQLSYTDLTQGGGAYLGDWDTNEFVLDISTLAGAAFQTRWLSAETDLGNFRNVSYEVSNNETFEDLELRSITAVLEGGASGQERNPSYENA